MAELHLAFSLLFPFLSQLPLCSSFKIGSILLLAYMVMGGTARSHTIKKNGAPTFERQLFPILVGWKRGGGGGGGGGSKRKREREREGEDLSFWQQRHTDETSISEPRDLGLCRVARLDGTKTGSILDIYVSLLLAEPARHLLRFSSLLHRETVTAKYPPFLFRCCLSFLRVCLEEWWEES